MRSIDHNKKCILDIESTADLWTGQLICIGIMNIDSKDKEIRIFTGKSEESLLMDFLKYYNENKFNTVIGYNTVWDFRFILSRCLKYRLRAETFYRANCVDLMMILKGFGKGYNYNDLGSLDSWSKLLSGRGKLVTDAPVPVLFQRGEIDQIIAHNQTDLKNTFMLWERLNTVIGDECT